MAERCRKAQNAGHLLALAPLVTREAEIPYAHDRLEDYNPAFVAEFRGWLAARYGRNPAALEAAWGGRPGGFDRVDPPRTLGGAAGRDWYRFRDLKARQFVDSCAAALAAVRGVTVPYRLLLDYGNVGDPMAWKRGSLSFAFHAANPAVWGVKHNDAHDYDHRYTGALLGGAARRMGRMAFNEWFYDRDKARYPGGDVVGDSVREIQAHYDQGMNGVSFVGVHPPNKDLEAIVGRLKSSGVWSAPVAARRAEDLRTVRIRLSEVLGLQGWDLKTRFFDPPAGAGRPPPDLAVERDFDDPLLPVLPPQEYGRD